MSLRDYINKVLNEINESIIKPLGDIESSAEGILETISEALNVDRPRVIATINPVSECNPGEVGPCGEVGGRYLVDGHIVLINYRMSMSTLLHLYSHHLQAIEMGRERFEQIRRTEELKLPWNLRPTEITAMYRTALLARSIPPRTWKVYNEEIKPKIKEIDERLKATEPLINHLTRQVEHIIMSR
ncbi:hypothetical protein [Vulcanisaeta thermophila]|uniref:hypothetical protein n=1 Tax=Vulcanisaeta thermophila TaxID=867917 RepID=UPI000852DED8|nr:hypothetical protein [Vulcanisaeta thermophila]